MAPQITSSRISSIGHRVLREHLESSISAKLPISGASDIAIERSVPERMSCNLTAHRLRCDCPGGLPAIQIRRGLSLLPENPGGFPHALARVVFSGCFSVALVTSPYQTLQMRVFYEPHTFRATEDFSSASIQHERTGEHTLSHCLHPDALGLIASPGRIPYKATNAEQGQHLSSPPH